MGEKTQLRWFVFSGFGFPVSDFPFWMRFGRGISHPILGHRLRSGHTWREANE